MSTKAIGNARQPGESFEDYRKRRQYNNWVIRNRLKMGRNYFYQHPAAVWEGHGTTRKLAIVQPKMVPFRYSDQKESENAQS